MTRQLSSLANILIAVTLVTLFAAPTFAQEETEAPSLYDRLGGLMGITVVIDDFVDQLSSDDVLNQNPHINEARNRVPNAYLTFHVVNMLCQAAGGPCVYTGRGMEESHAHLKISQSDWDRMMTIAGEVMTKHGVPEAEQAEIAAIVQSTHDAIVTVSDAP